MNLSHAPAEQLANARAAIAAAKATGLGYVRIYTSWNSRTQKVRVKFYYLSNRSNGRNMRMYSLGFRLHVDSFSRSRSFVGEF